MKKEEKIKFGKEIIDRVVSTSSKLEGLSFERACKNTKVIALLKKHGRGFSL